MAKIPLEPGLYLVSTPIGRANDISLHALDVLASAEVLVAEDTRVLRKLLSIHGIALGDRKIISHHDHSKDRDLTPIKEALSAGMSVAYASDAGTPMVSDPGYVLVQAALDVPVDVHAVPGASALLSALVVSGLPSDKVFFGGFLSSKSSARQTQLRDVVSADYTTVFYDTPKRLRATLQDCKAVLQEDRKIVLCRELTKLHEQTVRGTLSDVAAELEKGTLVIPEKGELVVLLGPVQKAEISDADIQEALRDVVDKEGVKRASQAVAEALKVPRNRVYALALKLKDNDNS